MLLRMVEVELVVVAAGLLVCAQQRPAMLKDNATLANNFVFIIGKAWVARPKNARRF
jgi:hypothetical protein